jgi:diguanylate cyclase (GGDEF)-like protein
MMALRHPGLSARFFVALLLLLGSLATVIVVASRGLEEVQSANDQVYSDNYLTSETTSAVAVELSRAESVSLRIAASRSLAESARLRAQLHQVLIPRVDASLARLVALHQADPPEELRTIRRIPVAWHRFEALAGQGALAESSGPVVAANANAEAEAIAATLDPLVTTVFDLQSIETTDAHGAHADARDVFQRSAIWLLIAAAIAAAAALWQIRIGLTLRGLVNRQAAEQTYGESEGEYIETLQVTEDEDEAQELLRRHLERSLPDARAVVLARNNSADRLESRTELGELDPLRTPLVGAAPRSCLAVRFARPHTEMEAGTALLSCEVCGVLPGVSTCEPLLVSGEVIGAVLITQPREPGEHERRRIRDAVGQAAPVLANLRNLALAEFRAATDALTGLPNQRAVQDTLKRMVAQATRAGSPLAALVVDVDHFKQINDAHGHDRGDEVLAAIGVTLRTIARESDFVGRYGGEEFLLLLPFTDHDGALRLGEATRRAIETIKIPGLDQVVTASVGVAVLPDHAGDSLTLFRSADRALYAAKRNGRNRVESAADHAAADTGTALPVKAA